MGDVVTPERPRPGGAPKSVPAASKPAPAASTSSKPVHKHVQVREYVRGLIQGAEPGSPAPSERELVQHFGVARMTVRQALDALVSEGLLERVPGRGTFVARAKIDVQVRLSSYTEEMARRGMKPDSRTLLARMESAGPGVARALEISEGDKVVHWQRLRLADGAPMCIEDAYLADSIIPNFLDQPLPESLYADLQRRDLMPTWGEDSVDAAAARPEEAELLGIPAGAPVLRIARRAFAGSIAIEVSRSTFRADRYTLWMPLSRPNTPVTPSR
jgi:GntR family transcriptional regulator